MVEKLGWKLNVPPRWVVDADAPGLKRSLGCVLVTLGKHSVSSSHVVSLHTLKPPCPETVCHRTLKRAAARPLMVCAGVCVSVCCACLSHRGGTHTCPGRSNDDGVLTLDLKLQVTEVKLESGVWAFREVLRVARVSGL